MIPIKQLKRGWYIGKGRNANIAYWTGSTFLTIGNKFGEYVIKDEGLWEEGWCFKPMQRISETKIENYIECLENGELDEEDIL